MIKFISDHYALKTRGINLWFIFINSYFILIAENSI